MQIPTVPGSTVNVAGILLALVAIVVLFVGAPMAARRFERQQKQRGRWDEYGPLEETEGHRPWDEAAG